MGSFSLQWVAWQVAQYGTEVVQRCTEVKPS